MCVHELWNYTECGCQVDHLVPCLGALTGNEPSRQSSPQRRCRRKTSLRGIRSPSPVKIIKEHAVNTSPVHLPPSPSPTDSDFSSRLEDYYRNPGSRQPRECSVNHSVTRCFLEPICDDCLLQELAEDNKKEGQAPNLSPATIDGLIWGSDVKIEVSEQQLASPQPQILESNVEVLIEEAVHDTLPALKYQNGSFGHARQASSLSADADDEGSFRGRPRSRSKQQRRKAFDITREQLRISSRLPTWDRQALETFRDSLQKKAQEALRLGCSTQKEQSSGKNLLTRFRRAEGGGKSWVRGMVEDLKRSLSRNSKRSEQAKEGVWQHAAASPKPHSPYPEVCTLRAVVDDASTIREEHRTVATEEEDICPAPDVPSSQDEPSRASSWQAHLHHDLASPSRHSNQIYTRRSTTHLNSISGNGRRNSSGPSWLAKSKSWGSLPLRSISERETRRHLLSMTTTAPSIPATASSTWSGPPTGQRFASIISQSEFDTLTEHPWNTPLDPNECTYDQITDATTIDDDATSTAPSSHQHGTSIDTKHSSHTANPASPPPSVCPHAEHSHADTPRPTKGLTMHPITTPLRIATPLRPGLTPRTSSLSSPPMSSPARLGSKAISHSPTAHFVCIWERYLCKGGCGKAVGENVRSCVCEGGHESGCRSTGPVVRYVTAVGHKQVCGRCDRV